MVVNLGTLKARYFVHTKFESKIIFWLQEPNGIEVGGAGGGVWLGHKSPHGAAQTSAIASNVGLRRKPEKK